MCEDWWGETWHLSLFPRMCWVFSHYILQISIPPSPLPKGACVHPKGHIAAGSSGLGSCCVFLTWVGALAQQGVLGCGFLSYIIFSGGNIQARKPLKWNSLLDTGKRFSWRGSLDQSHLLEKSRLCFALSVWDQLGSWHFFMSSLRRLSKGRTNGKVLIRKGKLNKARKMWKMSHSTWQLLVH